MKKTSLIIASISLILSACSNNSMPKACQESWKQIENIAKTSGVAEDAIQSQKKAFEDEVSKMNKEEAIQVCKTQSSILKMAK